jgi:hypothetical protein
VALLVIGLLVSFRVVASATRRKDGRARPERTPPRRGAGKKFDLLRGHLDLLLATLREAGPAHGYAIIASLWGRSLGAHVMPGNQRDAADLFARLIGEARA